MSTMKKHISMFLLALTMMVAMALPTFAVPNDLCAEKSYAENLLEQTLLRDCSPEISA